VTVIEEMQDLDQLGPAGTRLKLDLMLSMHHGPTSRDWARLSRDDRLVLRKVADEEDPAWGLSHQADAIGALGEMGDRGSIMQLSETARDRRTDPLLRIAATHSLGRIGTDQALPVLRELLDATVPEVRAQAAVGLMTAGRAADVVPLEDAGKRDRTFAGTVAKNAAEVLRRRLGLGVS